MDMAVDDDNEFKLLCTCACTIMYYYWRYIHKEPCMNSIQSGNMWLMELLQGNESRCYTMFRMDKDVFFRLCNDLETNYGLRGSRRMSVIEILGIFLHILGHGVGNRLVQERFQHSGETVSRYFGQVLDVVCRMAMDIIKPQDSDFRDIPEEILTDSRYMPHFKKKWKILKTMPNFSFDKQVKIVIATMALHNYIKRHAQRDRHFEESKNYQNEGTEEEMDEESQETNGPGSQEIEVLRNQITASLMGD
ncbi:hypothetical protein EZV62_015203 [Acer yangbiense]|uniref:DUF8040 domain-containing protein n=1 Tax=Acer yangbiense TaxID=1000413 RepID=A0A5C7HUV8_9ROSI|nr:hypothetical protein EZV62_015201 [Acer yangbiense]TXG60630.1 hypothetical protein EZV62_015203 [Acer yangbiense]